MSDIHDVIIIGAGPAGLSAAMYASRVGLDTLVLDKGAFAGALGMISKIENFPGVLQPMSGGELLSLLKEQAEKFGARIVKEQVIGVDLNSETKEIISSKNHYKTHSVIIASGSMARRATIEGEAQFLGKGVSYCAACDAPFFKRTAVALVGSLNEILEEVGTIAQFAHTIYLVTLQSISPQDKQNLNQGNIVVLPKHRLIKIYGTTIIEGIQVLTDENKTRDIAVKGVFIYLHGNQPAVEFLGDQLRVGENDCIYVDKDDMSTSIPGVFACGDVTCKKVRQAVVAASEGCIAALSAERYIRKKRGFSFQWH